MYEVHFHFSAAAITLITTERPRRKLVHELFYDQGCCGTLFWTEITLHLGSWLNAA